MLAMNNLKLLRKPEQFHGDGLNRNFFEGWYYKTLTEGGGSIIFIPGVFYPKSSNRTPWSSKVSKEHVNINEKQREAHAFVMAFRSPATSQCLYYRYPISMFKFTNNASDSGYTLEIGKSIFTEQKLTLDLDAEFLVWPTPEDEKQFYTKALAERKSLGIDSYFFASYDRVLYSIKGEIHLHDIVKMKQTIYAPGIMGPFAYLPLMECYHGIVSLHHKTTGSLEFYRDGSKMETITVNGGIGYIEKDHGFNFPKDWIWIQSSSFQKQEHEGSVLMISVADVPLLSDIGITSKVLGAIPIAGPAILSKGRITGFLVLLRVLGKTYNLSLFTGAKITKMEFSSITQGTDVFQICNIAFELKDMVLQVSAKRLLGHGVPLPGPSFAIDGMHLIVEESITVQVSVTFKIGDRIVFQDIGEEGGMEVVGSMDSMKSRI